MSISLHTIKPSNGSQKKRKRVGRGNASGHGTYSTRGMKGQKSRSGASGLKRLGMKMTLLRAPKKRGFKSGKDKDQVVNLIDLNDTFKDGEVINAKSLVKKGMIKDVKVGIKILGKGDLKVKNLKIEDIASSETARKNIEKLGGVFVKSAKKKESNKK